MEVCGFPVRILDYPIGDTTHRYVHVSELINSMSVVDKRNKNRLKVAWRLHMWMRTQAFAEMARGFEEQYGRPMMITKRGGDGYQLCDEYILPIMMFRLGGRDKLLKVASDPEVTRIANMIVMNHEGYQHLSDLDFKAMFWGKIHTAPGWKLGKDASEQLCKIRSVLTLAGEDAREIMDFTSCLLPTMFNPHFAIRLAYYAVGT